MDKWIQVLLVIVVGGALLGFCAWQYFLHMELLQLRRWARQDGVRTTDRKALRARYDDFDTP